MELHRASPAPRGVGRSRLHSPREILNAIVYILGTGCQWRLLPHHLPRWSTVYEYFCKWRIEGTWKNVNRAIRERLRARLNRRAQPSAGIVDSQSKRLSEWAGSIWVTTEARRSRAASTTCLWIRRFRKGPQHQGDGLGWALSQPQISMGGRRLQASAHGLTSSDHPELPWGGKYGTRAPGSFSTLERVLVSVASRRLLLSAYVPVIV